MESKCLVFLVCHDLVPLSQPASKQSFTPRQPIIYRCASTHFGENQLAPSSIGISPLTTAHPPIFQHRSVRTSTCCYPSFILAMVRSPGFGSIESDRTPCSDSLSLRLQRSSHFNQATSYKSPAHSSTGTRSELPYGSPPPTACKITVSCSISLPFRGSISPFPRGTCSLSVT
jgi:hypothetical protein